MSAKRDVLDGVDDPEARAWLASYLDVFARKHAHELAEKIRKHADDPRVKPHLLEGEWTGLRMGANVIDTKKEERRGADAEGR